MKCAPSCPHWTFAAASGALLALLTFALPANGADACAGLQKEVEEAGQALEEADKAHVAAEIAATRAANQQRAASNALARCIAEHGGRAAACGEEEVVAVRKDAEAQAAQTALARNVGLGGHYAHYARLQGELAACRAREAAKKPKVPPPDLPAITVVTPKLVLPKTPPIVVVTPQLVPPVPTAVPNPGPGTEWLPAPVDPPGGLTCYYRDGSQSWSITIFDSKDCPPIYGVPPVGQAWAPPRDPTFGRPPPSRGSGTTTTATTPTDPAASGGDSPLPPLGGLIPGVLGAPKPPYAPPSVSSGQATPPTQPANSATPAGKTAGVPPVTPPPPTTSGKPGTGSSDNKICIYSEDGKTLTSYSVDDGPRMTPTPSNPGPCPPTKPNLGLSGASNSPPVTAAHANVAPLYPAPRVQHALPASVAPGPRIFRAPVGPKIYFRPRTHPPHGPGPHSGSHAGPLAAAPAVTSVPIAKQHSHQVTTAKHAVSGGIHRKSWTHRQRIGVQAFRRQQASVHRQRFAARPTFARHQNVVQRHSFAPRARFVRRR